jgi:hypothetical protein
MEPSATRSDKVGQKRGKRDDLDRPRPKKAKWGSATIDRDRRTEKKGEARQMAEVANMKKVRQPRQVAKIANMKKGSSIRSLPLRFAEAGLNPRSFHRISVRHNSIWDSQTFRYKILTFIPQSREQLQEKSTVDPVLRVPCPVP